jgi:hypothetical protein
MNALAWEYQYTYHLIPPDLIADCFVSHLEDV